MPTPTLHPSEGVRVQLDLLHAEPDKGGARYRGTVYLPIELSARTPRFVVEVSATGAVSLRPEEETAATPETPSPEFHTAIARARDLLVGVAKTVGRHALAMDAPRWPRRLLRWRAP